MPDFISVFSGKKRLFKERLDEVKTNPITLRPYQNAMLDEWLGANDGEQSWIGIAPTGSGKSVVIATKAAINYSNGISTFILIPKLSITGAFDQTSVEGFNVRYRGSVYSLPVGTIKHVTGAARISGASKLLELANWNSRLARSTPQIGVMCYESFKEAYAAVGTINSNQVEVIIDEAHHVRTNDGATNGMGELVKRLTNKQVQMALFTATGYRADGGTIVQDSRNFEQFRRTLREHYDEGWCPDIDIHFRFYDRVAECDYAGFESKTDDTLIIDTAEQLISAYVKEFRASGKRPTLMILPVEMRTRAGEKIKAAKIACDLERVLAQDSNRVLNLGGFDADKLVADSTAEYEKRLSTLHQSKDTGLDVVISIKVMDEGVDWRACEAVYMPRIPHSLPLIMQRIGRSTRKKPTSSSSRVVFFELGVDGDDGLVVPAMMRTACRLKCLFHGLEFQESFAINGGLRQRLLRISTHKLQSADEAIHQVAARHHGKAAARLLLETIKDEYAYIGVDLEPSECVDIAVVSSVFDGYDGDELVRTTKRFLRRLRGSSRDFQYFFDDPEVQSALDELVVQGPYAYARLLSGRSAKQIERLIVEWHDRSFRIDQKKSVLIRMARSGAKRPHKRSGLPSWVIDELGGNPRDIADDLRMVLWNSIREGRGTYDRLFKVEVERHAPGWLLTRTALSESELMKLAETGEPRPAGRRVSKFLRAHRVFAAKIFAIRPDWKLDDSKEKRVDELMRLADSGAKRPSTRSPDKHERNLASSLSGYCNPASESYAKEFASSIRIKRPDWFKNSDKNKAALLASARRGDPRPRQSTALGKARSNYMNRSSKSYDDEFTQEVVAVRPEWAMLRDHSKFWKETLLKVAPGLPKPSFSWPPTKAWNKKLTSYIEPCSGSRDDEFVTKMSAANPRWLERRNDKYSEREEQLWLKVLSCHSLPSIHRTTARTVRTATGSSRSTKKLA